jgi:hypothetical protein
MDWWQLDLMRPLAAVLCVHQCIDTVMPNKYSEQHRSASSLLLTPCLRPLRSSLFGSIEHLLHFMLHFANAALHVLVRLWGDGESYTSLKFTLRTNGASLSGSYDRELRVGRVTHSFCG